MVVRYIKSHVVRRHLDLLIILLCLGYELISSTYLHLLLLLNVHIAAAIAIGNNKILRFKVNLKF